MHLAIIKKMKLLKQLKTSLNTKKEQQPEIQINELIKETMEAVNCGLEHAIWDIENAS